MKHRVYTVVYAGILAAACALLLTAAADFTAPYKAANARAEEVLSILTVLKVPLEREMTKDRLVETYEAVVGERALGNTRAYIYSTPDAPDEPKATAIRFSGRGVWGPVRGFLALEPDMKTIMAIVFYEQEETPGLGGEIASEWFTEQFVGKSIIDSAGMPGMMIGGSLEESVPTAVDAITGATMTSDRVEAMLNDVIELIAEEYHTDG